MHNEDHQDIADNRLLERKTMLVPIEELRVINEINSRTSSSDALISRYSEALESGDEIYFPPILVQKVTGLNGDGPTTIIIDGIHRWNAYKAKERKEIEVVEWKPGEVLDYQEWKSAMLMESAFRNSVNGEPLSRKQKEAVAIAIAEGDPEQKIKQGDLAKVLAVAQGTISNWITDIRQRQNGNRDARIIKLARLGWTQEAIAAAVGLSDHSAISKIVKNINFDNFHTLLSQGRDMAYVAQHYQIPQALAWAIRMDEHTDMERFKALEWGLRTWDLWNFNDCDNRFGDDWPGRIPAQLVAHTLYFFTNPGDVVFDPMAGGGVVPDTCLAFNRKCRAFDISTREHRPEIEKHAWEVGSMTWPDAPKADLIFFDPPYYKKMEKEYDEKAAGQVTPISSLDRQTYLDFFAEFFSLAKENTKPDARIAFLNADWRDFQSKAALSESPENDITVFDYHRLLSDAGWTVTHRIECPMSTERMSGNTVLSMQGNRTLGIVCRTLLVAKKGP